MGRNFKVKIDHDSFKYFLEQRLSSQEQQKWVTKMLGYDFEIIYKKGKQNVVEDALSRKDEDVEALLCAISIIQLDWINEARDEWKNDEEVWALIQKIQQDPNTSDTFSWKNDSLWYKDQLYLVTLKFVTLTICSLYGLINSHIVLFVKPHTSTLHVKTSKREKVT